MLNNLFKKKREEGFTIIEVLIVLAIAGLILVIVLIAVPQLQRNQRNEARRADAARVGTSVSNWSANNNGQVLTAGAGNANLTAVLNDLGDVGQYNLTAGGTFVIASGDTAAVANLTDIRVVTAAQCSTNGAAVAAGAAPRQFVIQFATETSSGTPQGQCIDV